MKEDLLKLIDEIPTIETKFHRSSGAAGLGIALKIINDVEDFKIWLEKVKWEVQEINDRAGDSFINELLSYISLSFDGWNDEKLFATIKAKLLTVKGKIDKYYPNTIDTLPNLTYRKPPKIFISHKTEDKPYIEKIVRLLEFIGVKKENIFCSSIAGYGVPNSQDIFDFLREQYENYELYIIFIHSSNYYSSTICMNEMGAAWVLRCDYISFLLPGFEFSQMKGVIGPRTAGIKLDADPYEVKDRLNQFRDTLSELFGIQKKDDITWEKERDKFITEVNSLIPNNSPSKVVIDKEQLSSYAEELLINASKSDHSSLVISVDFSGTTIQTTPKCYSSSMGDRAFSFWEAALKELEKGGYIERYGKDNALYKVTSKGYTYLDNKI